MIAPISNIHRCGCHHMLECPVQPRIIKINPRCRPSVLPLDRFYRFLRGWKAEARDGAVTPHQGTK